MVFIAYEKGKVLHIVRAMGGASDRQRANHLGNISSLVQQSVHFNSKLKTRDPRQPISESNWKPSYILYIVLPLLRSCLGLVNKGRGVILTYEHKNDPKL